MFERIQHMLIKEFIQVFRDPRMRIVIFLIPCFQVLVIGYAVSTDVKHVRTAVYDLDNSQASRDLAARFVRSGYFDVVARVGDEDLVEMRVVALAAVAVVVAGVAGLAVGLAISAPAARSACPAISMSLSVPSSAASAPRTMA